MANYECLIFLTDKMEKYLVDEEGLGKSLEIDIVNSINKRKTTQRRTHSPSGGDNTSKRWRWRGREKRMT